MRQTEWHRLVKRHILPPLQERWPGAAVHKPWIVLEDGGYRCWAIGWAVRRWPPDAISNYAKVHIDFVSGSPFSIDDLHLTLGGSPGREDWVEVGDGDVAEAESMAILSGRMINLAGPFFDSLKTEDQIRERLSAIVLDDHPLQLARTEVLAGLDLLAGRLEDSAGWYEKAVVISERDTKPYRSDFYEDRHRWLVALLEAVHTDPERGRTMLTERAIAYRQEGKLPPRPPGSGLAD